ncbi:hypothetical protein DFS34DRAFT_671056 [Phlyctochytrium arcticum]|nr:hypothetical protein DFS34DRAFT_671056 [Phlyctochytrium arcticum]
MWKIGDCASNWADLFGFSLGNSFSQERNMPMTQLELQRRQVALVKAVKANDITKVRRLLKNCREWDSVHHGIINGMILSPTCRISHHPDGELCSCCFKSGEWMSPARGAALHIAIALGSQEHDSAYEKQVEVAALEIFKKAVTVPVLEFCMPLTNGLSDDDRNKALNDALSRGHTEAAGFLIQHGAAHDQSTILSCLRDTSEESHFLYVWNLLGGTGNFSALTHDNNRNRPPVYEAMSRGYWNVLETCLGHPAFKMTTSHRSNMVPALCWAVRNQQEKLLWHMIENVPESKSLSHSAQPGHDANIQ